MDQEYGLDYILKQVYDCMNKKEKALLDKCLNQEECREALNSIVDFLYLHYFIKQDIYKIKEIVKKVIHENLK